MNVIVFDYFLSNESDNFHVSINGVGSGSYNDFSKKTHTATVLFHTHTYWVFFHRPFVFKLYILFQFYTRQYLYYYFYIAILLLLLFIL